MTATARSGAAWALLLCVTAVRAAPPEPGSPEAAAPEPAPEAAPAEAGAPATAPDAAAELRERLAAREHEVAALRGELERLKAKNAAAPPAAGPPAAPPTPADVPLAAAAPPGASSGPASGAAPAAAVATDVAPPLFDLPGTRRPLPAWQVEIGAAVGALLLGFGLGWRTLDRRIRRKYGGLRIY